jgi:hypothetical protein
LKLAKIKNDQVIDAIAFNQDRLTEGRYQTLAYRLDVKEFLGLTTIQLMIGLK